MGKTSKDDAGEEIRVVRTRVPLFLGNEATTCIVVYFVYSAEKKQRTIRRGKPFLLNLITELINFLTTFFVSGSKRKIMKRIIEKNDKWIFKM